MKNNYEMVGNSPTVAQTKGDISIEIEEIQKCLDVMGNRIGELTTVLSPVLIDALTSTDGKSADAPCPPKSRVMLELERIEYLIRLYIGMIEGLISRSRI